MSLERKRECQRPPSIACPSHPLIVIPPNHPRYPLCENTAVAGVESVVVVAGIAIPVGIGREYSLRQDVAKMDEEGCERREENAAAARGELPERISENVQRIQWR